MCEARQGSRRADRAAPPCAWVKVLAQAEYVVFGRRREAREPRMCERLLGCKAARRVWIELRADEALCCRVAWFKVR
jgi:hypothetical protein